MQSQVRFVRCFVLFVFMYWHARIWAVGTLSTAWAGRHANVAPGEEGCGGHAPLHAVLTKLCGWGRYFEQRVGWAVTQTWHLVEKDVEDTLEAVGDRVLAERGVEPSVLRRRAEGMRVIAEVFQVGPRVCRSAGRACARCAAPPRLGHARH